MNMFHPPADQAPRAASSIPENVSAAAAPGTDPTAANGDQAARAADNDRAAIRADTTPAATRPEIAAATALDLNPAATMPDRDRAVVAPVNNHTATAAAPDARAEPLDLVSTRIPHVTIHVFSESTEFAEIWERAARDRRLAAATATLRPGGLDAALALYASERSPDLIIAETDLGEDEICLQLDALADLCRPGTKVIIIGRKNDIQLYQRLLDMGVSDYLIIPVSIGGLIGSIAELYRTPGAARIGRIAAVIGAKGGVGTSTIAQSLALKLGLRHGAAALLVDLDVAFGAGLLENGLDRTQGLIEALRDPDRVDAEMLDRLSVRRGAHLALLGTAADLDSGIEIDGKAIERILDVARTHFCRVVLDVPHLWSPWVERLLIAADDVLIVSTAELASLANVAALTARMRALRPNDSLPLLVLNQTGTPGRRGISARDVTRALGLSPAISMPFDPKAFNMADLRNRMIADIARRRPFGRACERLVELVDQKGGQDRPAITRRKRGFLSALKWPLGKTAA